MAEQPGQSEWKWPTEEPNSVCSWLPDQEEQVEGALYRLMGVSCCQASVSFAGLFHSSICCRDSTAGHTASRRSLERTYGSFLTQAIEEPKRRGALLDLILTRKEGVVGKVKNQREPGLWWPWDGGAEEPEGGGKRQAHTFGLQESTPWLLQVSVGYSPAGYGSQLNRVKKCSNYLRITASKQSKSIPRSGSQVKTSEFLQVC